MLILIIPIIACIAVLIFNYYNPEEKKDCNTYNTAYVKGTVRGATGRFVSNNILEERRKMVNKLNSKF